jgi:exodeoxyribonuclease VII large subunit
MLRVLGERWPVAEIFLRPCAVQGEGAAEQIVEALEDLQEIDGLDLILLGRGGGSIEDLWSFNQEAVVRAVAASRVPVVTGIGHEIDITLSDLAADLRAATPSQAAELSVPDRAELLRQLRGQGSRVRHHTRSRFRTERLRLSKVAGSHGFRRPLDLIRTRIQRIDELWLRLGHRVTADLTSRRQSLAELRVRWRAHEPRERLCRSRGRLTELRERASRSLHQRMQQRWDLLRARSRHLEAVGPRSVLSRGYAICLRAQDGHAVRSYSDVDVGAQVQVILERGELDCEVGDRYQQWRRESHP